VRQIGLRGSRRNLTEIHVDCEPSSLSLAPTPTPPLKGGDKCGYGAGKGDIEMTKQELVQRMQDNQAWVPGKKVKLDFGGDGVIMLDGAG